MVKCLTVISGSDMIIILIFPGNDGGAAVVATGYTLLVAVCVLISSFAI